ncbi:pyridoxal phosphate-dependent aminotransferase [Photobacterium sp. WH77]|uniref:pyridoxal phosphate-dependent aminotransferase n=1 Tax=Photobacterium TaxID=657 RepID=UPI001EDC7604|nr:MULTISPECIES: pyridoxal phosphate-dependent aminotransferase [Photobacterium]MCG2838087.1 pyridoxal phosphate-dependent aminotransferase [Photobacterium sp. WH77]MCG2845705.1 pyridoxal phosphate-dependent aminotransferase [Photobacterium sp. WH80]
MLKSVFSATAMKLRESVTHGTKAKITALNASAPEGEEVIDLSIGTLDDLADDRINEAVIRFIQTQPRTIHEFAPVTGFGFLRQSISERIFRLRGVKYAPENEIMVTPGGIKGAITVVFHTLLNPGDEVIVPLPNWPHYADMIELHGGVMKGILVRDFYDNPLTPEDLDQAISDRTKMVILGDCLNPSGKIYRHEDLSTLSEVIARHNLHRQQNNQPPIQVLFDCPYESHILNGPATISNVTVTFENGVEYAMRDCTTFVTGPGKTYGMHGDRVGYICSTAEKLVMMARVQVNLNSFAATYAQVATHAAMQECMDEVAKARAINSRLNLEGFVEKLNAIPQVRVPIPEGGFFIFADFSGYGEKIATLGYGSAQEFILDRARVASIGGLHFAEGVPELKHFIRLNAGRSESTLRQAAERIRNALLSL